MLLALGTSAAVALPGNLPAGTQISSGAVSLQSALPSLGHNPALLGRMLKDGQSLALNGFRLPAVALEIGDVEGSDWVDELDQLEDRLDALEDNPSEEEAQAIVNDFDDLLVRVASQARVGLDLSMPVPALPVVFRAFDGVMAVNLEVAGALDGRVLSTGVQIDPNDNTDVVTDTSVYARAGTFAQLAAAYSRPIMPLPLGPFAGELQAGARLKLIQGALGRVVARVEDDGNDEDSAFDRAGDNYDQNEKTTTTVGLDVGVGYIADGFTAGLTLRNLIPAEFDYATLGENCASLPEGGERADCEGAADLIGKGLLKRDERFKLELQPMIETSYAFGDSGLSLFGSLDLTAADNLAGTEYQWLHLGLAYAGPWWAPEMRLAYRSNIANGGVDVFAVGLNLFRFLSIEAFQATDSAEFDGDKYPRSAGVSIGFSTRF